MFLLLPLFHSVTKVLIITLSCFCCIFRCITVVVAHSLQWKLSHAIIFYSDFFYLEFWIKFLAFFMSIAGNDKSMICTFLITFKLQCNGVYVYQILSIFIPNFPTMHPRGFAPFIFLSD